MEKKPVARFSALTPTGFSPLAFGASSCSVPHPCFVRRHVRRSLGAGGSLGEGRRALTIIELLVTLAILTGLFLVNLKALQVMRRLSQRDETMTRLALQANSELSRLRAMPWNHLRPGKRPLTIHGAHAKTVQGEALIEESPGLSLKTLTVRLRETTPSGPCQIELATWRGRDTQ